MAHNSVVMSRDGKVLFTVETEESSIDVAGAISADGAPVNIKSYKISRSKKNLSMAEKVDYCGLVRREHNGHVFYVYNI